MRHRPGMSRADVLIGLLIAVLAILLVLAGVGNIREAANRMQCQNHLKQLGIAAHSYIDANGRLPPLVDRGEGTPTGRGLPSVFATLMPFLEATPVVFRPERSPDYYHAHSSIKCTYSGKEEPITEDGGMANYPISYFLDPADATAKNLRDVPMTLPDGTLGYYATGSYAANGLAPWNIIDIAESFSVDAANTILFAERPQVCRTATGEEVHNLWGLGFYSPQMPTFATLTPTEPSGLLDTGQVAPAQPLPAANDPERDKRIRVRIGSRSGKLVSPDFSTPIQRIRAGQPCDPCLPGTPHADGMQVLMGDGSVRIFGLDNSPWVFWSACTSNEPSVSR